MQNKKTVILRLSSLGDLILATSALEVNAIQSVDWIVGEQFSELLVHHPKINKLFTFNRKAGFGAWIRLCRQIWENQYDEVLDLHRSLRSKLMRVIFFYWALKERSNRPRWKVVSKQRWRLYLYFIFKKSLPAHLRPIPWAIQFPRTVGGRGDERPNLKHLLEPSFEIPAELKKVKAAGRSYLCVMPSSRWDGKKWPLNHYLEVIKELNYFPVILGSHSDRESVELVHALSSQNIPHFSGVGIWDLKQNAAVLSQSKGYLGGDTGLAHLAEAVGVSANVIFGPTASGMGFGPWRKGSQAIELDLSCRPCSKDGRKCYRLTEKYKCLKSLSAGHVLQALKVKE